MPRSFDSVFYGAAGGGEDLPSDPSFNLVGFLSHFDGANNGVNNAFDDGSTNNHTVTANGNVTQGSFGPFALGSTAVYDPAVNGASAFFDGTGDYLSMDGPGTLAASANWCMECFFYCNDSDPGIVRIMSVNEATDADAFTLMRIRNNKYEFYSGGGSSYAYSNQIGTANYNEWAHIALTKSGTTVRAFVNGIKLWEATHNATNVIAKLITGWGYGSEYFPGYISDARFVNGSSIYTANFTPPTAPLTAITNTSQLLNMSNGQAIDNKAANNLTLEGQAKLSTAQKKFGDSSFVLRGTNTGDFGKCIIEPFGTGNFTVECFVRINDKSDNQGFFQIANGWVNSAVKGPALEIRSGRWRWFYGNGGNAWHGSAGPAANDTWYHIAFVRNGTTSTFYADGTAVLTASDSTNYTWGHLAIGVNYDANYYFGGYIDEFRITRMARYTSNFTPSTEPFADRGQ